MAFSPSSTVLTKQHHLSHTFHPCSTSLIEYLSKEEKKKRLQLKIDALDHKKGSQQSDSVIAIMNSIHLDSLIYSIYIYMLGFLVDDRMMISKSSKKKQAWPSIRR